MSFGRELKDFAAAGVTGLDVGAKARLNKAQARNIGAEADAREKQLKDQRDAEKAARNAYNKPGGDFGNAGTTDGTLGGMGQSAGQGTPGSGFGGTGTTGSGGLAPSPIMQGNPAGTTPGASDPAQAFAGGGLVERNHPAFNTPAQRSKRTAELLRMVADDIEHDPQAGEEVLLLRFKPTAYALYAAGMPMEIPAVHTALVGVLTSIGQAVARQMPGASSWTYKRPRRPHAPK